MVSIGVKLGSDVMNADCKSDFICGSGSPCGTSGTAGIPAMYSSFIGGGTRNTVSRGSSSIVGGTDNTLGAESSFIGGGEANAISNTSKTSFIGGGTNNAIGAVGGVATINSAIVGGSGNIIDDTGAITTNSIVGGGDQNFIGAGASYASIFGGQLNQVTGAYSSILGGSGNNDGGFNYVGIFGQNVNGVMNNAFHAEEIVLQNIPVDTTATGTGPYATLPSGALYTNVATPSFLGRTVYVK